MARRDGLSRYLALGVILALVSLPDAWAHPLAFTEVTLTLETPASFVVDMIVDLDALALGAPQDTDDAELVAALTALSPADQDEIIDRLARLFQRRVRVRFDGERMPFDVTFPDRGTPRATESAIPTVLGLTARLAGTAPMAATTVEFFASRAFSDVHLTVVDMARGTRMSSVLERGARSDPFDLIGPIAQPSVAATAQRYARLGFVHIIPSGLDHVLFVVGIYLLSLRIRTLVVMVSAFTVAHALTLGLGAFRLLSLDPNIVEPLIALSIAWIGVDNVWRSTRATPATDQRWRTGVVFSFGLLHGLGFAGVLGELGLPEGERLLGLVAFNVGIEVGQLAVIAVAASLLAWCRPRPWFRPRVVTPLSLGIATIGFVWAVERALS